MDLRQRLSARPRTTLTRLARCLVAAGLLVGLAVAAPGRTAVAAGSATGTIDWNDVRQPIDGFGASGSFGQAGAIQRMPEPARSQIIDLLFSKDTGIGLTMVRNLLPQIESVPGVYSFDGDTDQIWLMNQAKARGQGVRFMSTAWSPPKWMKDNQSLAGGGSVLPVFYASYADYLAEYVLQYKSRFGLDIYGVSPANEPDASTGYDSSRWTGDQFRDFTRDFLAPVWAQKKVPAKYILPESSFWGEDMALPSLNDADFLGIPGAGKRVDIVAAHGYGRDNPPAPLTVSKAAGKRVWETETAELGIAEDLSIDDGLFLANRVNTFMTGPEVSLFNAWWLATEVPNVREGLIDVHPSATPPTYEVPKRLYALGNYSRFVRPGWERIGAFAGTTPITAFRDPATGKFAVVVINSGAAVTQNLQLSGFAASTVTPYTTSATQDLAAGAPIDASTGTISATLPAKSITTFVGTGTPTTKLSVRVTGGKVWSGESLPATVVVRNTGTSTAAGSVTTSSPGLTVTPASAPFTLAAGASTTIPVTVSAPTTATAGIQTLTASALATGDTAPATGLDNVVVSTTGISFLPGSTAEAPWMLSGGSGLDGGGNRFNDGSAVTIYRFDLPADVSGGTISVDVDNQYTLATSTDGTTYTTRYTAPPTTRVVRTVDLNTARAGSRTVYLRVGDSQPADGNGGRIHSVTVDVTRTP
jgi:glucuronoarabinoxylan endo-1,4-beta-xylanase